MGRSLTGPAQYGPHIPSKVHLAVQIAGPTPRLLPYPRPQSQTVAHARKAPPTPSYYHTHVHHDSLCSPLVDALVRHVGLALVSVYPAAQVLQEAF